MDNIAQAERSFLERHPGYRNTAVLDELRRAQYERLDRLGHRYLDYTGASLYSSRQVEEHMRLLLAEVFGNPHSSNPTSQAATRLILSARESVLDFFHADPNEYVVIFTQNASGALKLVGESYPFSEGCRYLLTFDNHNSVNGIRELARAKGSDVTYAPVIPPDMRIDEKKLDRFLEHADPGGCNLFAYPAQSNFSGVQHSLEWIARAQTLGWDVLLDAAAFVPTNRLDLSRWHPDFVTLSFYKMFGYVEGRRGLCLLPARRHAGALVRVVGVTGRAPRLLHVVVDDGDDHVVAEAAITRTVVVDDVTEPRLALVHSLPRRGQWQAEKPRRRTSQSSKPVTTRQ